MKAQPQVITRRQPANQYTESTNTANVLTEIYRVWVPRGKVWMLDDTRPARILLATQETVEGVGDHSAHAMSYAIARVLQPDGGHADGDYQSVVLKSNNTARTISAVADHVDSVGSPTITCSDETNADHVWSYVPYASGQLVMSIEAPQGQGQLSKPVMVRNTRELHSMNQFRDLRIGNPIAIPPDYAIVLRLNAAWQVAWTTGASSGATNLPWCHIQLPIRVLPESHFYERNEKFPGAALKARVNDFLMKSVR